MKIEALFIYLIIGLCFGLYMRLQAKRPIPITLWGGHVLFGVPMILGGACMWAINFIKNAKL